MSSTAPTPPDERSGKAPEASARALPKGQQTKAAIVDAALALATHLGLESLSIGALAERTGMSKSGVFAHFGSREELQISVIREYHARFEQEVFRPAMAAPRGVGRLQALLANWMQRSSIELDAGCIYISGSIEFEDRPGPVRDALLQSVMAWHAALKQAIRLAKREGEIAADADEDQMLFEIHGLILSLHYDARFLQSPGALQRAQKGFDNVVARYSIAPPAVAV